MQTEDKPYSGVQCNLSFKMANDQHDGKMSHSCNQCILFANSATTPAHKLVTSRNTCWHLRERKTCRTNTFQLHTVQLLLHNCWCPQDTHPNPFGRNAFQLHTVWILLHNNFLPQETHAGSQWREAFCLQTVQLLLHTSWWPQEAHANTFGREAFQLHAM